MSDAFGYDIGALTASDERIHLEVKATTDPTRLVVHLTRHESEVMSADPGWIMGAVLVGEQGDALSVATVSRSWLLSAVPHDRSSRGRWESARLVVPPHALKSGLIIEGGKRVLPGASCRPWGLGHVGSRSGGSLTEGRSQTSAHRFGHGRREGVAHLAVDGGLVPGEAPVIWESLQ